MRFPWRKKSAVPKPPKTHRHTWTGYTGITEHFDWRGGLSRTVYRMWLECRECGTKEVLGGWDRDERTGKVRPCQPKSS